MKKKKNEKSEMTLKSLYGRLASKMRALLVPIIMEEHYRILPPGGGGGVYTQHKFW